MAPWKTIAWLVAAGVLLAGIALARQRSHLPAVTEALPATAVSDGRALYVHCQGCHGVQGAGIPGFAPPVRGAALLRGDPVALARLVVHGSISRAPWPQPMPGLGQRLTDSEIATLLTWLRQEWGPVPDPVVTAAQVAAARPWSAP